MSKNTPGKERKKLIGQGLNLNLDSAATYFSDSAGRGPKPMEGWTVLYSQMDRELGRPIRTRISDCTSSRKKGNLLVRSGDQELRLPMAMKSLEVRLPYSSEFRLAKDVLG